MFAAFALGEAVDRPVRFVGRPDIAPVGRLQSTLGGLLAHPESGGRPRRRRTGRASAPITTSAVSGSVDHTSSAPHSPPVRPSFPAPRRASVTRSARVEIGPALAFTRKRRGPLLELELADLVRLDIGRLLDELGELRTGTPLDWLPLSGLGGA